MAVDQSAVDADGAFRAYHPNNRLGLDTIDHAGRPDQVASDECGDAVDEAEVVYRGRCPQCVAAPSVSYAAECGHMAEHDSLGPKETNVTSNRSSEGNSEQGEGQTCLTAAAKARAQ